MAPGCRALDSSRSPVPRSGRRISRFCSLICVGLLITALLGPQSAWAAHPEHRERSFFTSSSSSYKWDFNYPLAPVFEKRAFTSTSHHVGDSPYHGSEEHSSPFIAPAGGAYHHGPHPHPSHSLPFSFEEDSSYQEPHKFFNYHRNFAHDLR